MNETYEVHLQRIIIIINNKIITAQIIQIMENKKRESKLPSGCTEVWATGFELELKQKISLKRTIQKGLFALKKRKVLELQLVLLSAAD